MVQLSNLAKEDIQNLCKIIDLSEVRKGFEKNPKEFAHLRPGFRAAKLSNKDTVSLVINNIDKPFINGLMTEIVKELLSGIDVSCKAYEKRMFSKNLALLKTIPYSVFSENPDLYFKLTDDTSNEQYISLFKDALSLQQNTKISKKTKVVSEENNELVQANNTINQLKETINEKDRALKEAETKNINANNDIAELKREIESKDERIVEMQSELDHYRDLASYADADNSVVENKFQHISIGQVKEDHFAEKRWINRLADIVDGEVKEFLFDPNKPKFFDNRKSLFWKNGPDTDGVIGIWNWSAEPNRSNPATDFVVTDYNKEVRLTEVVEFNNCKSLSEIAETIKDKFPHTFSCEKVLFVCGGEGIRREALLCYAKDFEIIGGDARLLSSVFMLRQYSVNITDILDIDGKRIYRYINLGIPINVYRVRTPYAVVKELIIKRATMSVLREQGLSKKEAQNCQAFLKGLPTDSLIQNLADDYKCSEEEANKYYNDFMLHAESYLSADDFDTETISAVLSRSRDLVEKCKRELKDEWEEENAEAIQTAEERLKEVENEQNMHIKRVEELQKEYQATEDKISEIQKQILEKQKLASDVEANVALRIEAAKKNVASFISDMAFALPANNILLQKNNDEVNSFCPSNKISIDAEIMGDIDNVNDFENELADNLEIIGYEKKKNDSYEIAYEMAQAITFCIGCNMPILISENAREISKCIAAVLDKDSLVEIRVPISGFNTNAILSKIVDECTEQRRVFLISGAFDSFNINLFNSITEQMDNLERRAIIVFSLQGVPVEMIPAGVWNHVFYIDGDLGFTGLQNEDIHSFKTLLDFESIVEKAEYKEKRKSIQPYQSFLTNMVQNNFAKYLAKYNNTINKSQIVLSQMVAIAKANGVTEELKEKFQQNGIAVDAGWLSEMF